MVRAVQPDAPPCRPVPSPGRAVAGSLTDCLTPPGVAGRPRSRLACRDVDGLRNYPEEPEQRWYSERYRGDTDERYDGYRVPDPRYEEQQQQGWAFTTSEPPLREERHDERERYLTQQVSPGLSDTASSGLSAPTAPGFATPLPPMAPAAPASGPGPTGSGGAEPGGNVYRTRRAGVAVLLVVAAIVAELRLARLLLVAEFGVKATPGGVLAGLFSLAGVPLVARGLHGLATGAASAGNSPARQWLRVPLAYLPVGLVLLLAAALAIR